MVSLPEYNEARIRAAIAGHQAGPHRNGNPPPGRVIPGPVPWASATRINTGDPRLVSVTPGRQGGRPRVHTTPAAGNRARQRAYRVRRRNARPATAARPDATSAHVAGSGTGAGVTWIVI